MLANLSLLFIPAGVGVVQKLDVLAEHGIAIIVILAVSVLVTMLATVATFLARKPADDAAGGEPMSDNPFSLWVYLSQSPLLWLTVTLVVYAVADAVSLATHRHPLANPVLHSIWIVGVVLLMTGTSYPSYFAGAQFVHFLLGPATVALAVPLYENRKLVVAASCRCWPR